MGGASHLRAWARFLGISVFTAHQYFWWLVTSAIGLVSRRGVRAAHDFVARTWAAGMAFLLGMRIRVVGTPPEPPFLLVSNHLSYADIVALMSQVPCTFLSKAEIGRWPMIGLLARSTGTLFVDRTKKSDLVRSIAEIDRALERGRGVVVFPEGTSSEGRAVLPFKPSILEAAACTGREVCTASLSYSVPSGRAPAHLAICWWGDMDFLPHVYRMLQLPGFEARIVFGAERFADTDRKRLALSTQAAVAAGFVPVVSGERSEAAPGSAGAACAR